MRRAPWMDARIAWIILRIHVVASPHQPLRRCARARRSRSGSRRLRAPLLRLSSGRPCRSALSDALDPLAAHSDLSDGIAPRIPAALAHGPDEGAADAADEAGGGERRDEQAQVARRAARLGRSSRRRHFGVGGRARGDSIVRRTELVPAAWLPVRRMRAHQNTKTRRRAFAVPPAPGRGVGRCIVEPALAERLQALARVVVGQMAGHGGR